MRTLDQLNVAGKRVLVRVDYNVPLNSTFTVADDTRIRASLPTLRHLLAAGASLILVSHLGRPKKGPDDALSLRHIVPAVSEALGVPVQFVPESRGEQVQAAAAALQPGQVLLLENLRFHPEEEKGDPAFAQALASLADAYVNDAFGTAHRAHASTAVVAQYMHGNIAAGYLLQAEVDNANRVMAAPTRPYTAIMGGAKVSDKILIIERLLDAVDHLIIGGGMVYTFIKAQGGAIGNSLVEDDKVDLARTLLAKAEAKGVKIHLPMDSLCADRFAPDAATQTANNMHIPTGWMGLDIGPDAIATFAALVADSKTIVWNGPMGVFEMEAFSKGTRAIAQAVADATTQGAYSLIGGGDSAAAVVQFGFADSVSYVSTGGGALLEYMEGKTLPGVAALA